MLKVLDQIKNFNSFDSARNGYNEYIFGESLERLHEGIWLLMSR